METKSEDLRKLLEYIAERERNLSRYSDKLRQSLVKISNIFGDKDFCRICNMKIGDVHKGHTPIPKIEISISFIDDTPFYETNDTEYYLCIKEHHLQILARDKMWKAIEFTYSFNTIGREILKQLVRSKRLTKFLEKVAEELKTKEEEYREISEIAEKMANAIM